MNVRFTILTPTYNRANFLNRLFESLKNQTFKDFEWLIIDDGSTDNTREIVHSYQILSHNFKIEYIFQQNGGKHRALNTGIKHARGELIFIADSDDWLPDNGLEICDVVEKSIPASQKQFFAGISGVDGFNLDEIVGTTYRGIGWLDITFSQREKYGIWGDRKEVYYLNVLKDFPFPEFENENFLSEGVVWERIANAGLKIRHFNKIIYLVEYQQDGISNRQGEYFANSPLGWALYVNQEISFQKMGFLERWNMRYGYYGTLRHCNSLRIIAKYLEVSPLSLFIMAKFLRLYNKLISIFRRKKNFVSHEKYLRINKNI